MINKPQVICHIEKQVNNITIHDSSWIPCSPHFIILGSNSRRKGVLQIYEVEETDVRLVCEDEKNKPLRCGTFGASSLGNRQIAVGDMDGFLKIWTLGEIQKYTYSEQAHDGPINCIDGVGGKAPGFGAPEIVTGGADGLVKVWDPRQNHKPVAIMESENGVRRECWSVTFGNSYNSEERVVCAGFDNGDIKMFDLKNMSLRWETNVTNGVCCLEFDSREIKMNKLVATALQGNIHMFDLKNKETNFPCVSEKGQTGTVWFGRHLPQNRDIIATCAGSGSLYIWKYHYTGAGISRYGGEMELLQNNNVSSQAASSFSWCPDKIGLALHTSYDEMIRVLIVTKLNRVG